MRPPIELEVAEAYELWAGTYPPHAHNALMRAEERAMLAWLPDSLFGSCVVDVGCGSGRYLIHARRRGASVLGVDLSPAMLRAARELELPVVCADLLRLPVRSGCADLALCGLALGHTAALPAALSELARVLRAGGTALCSELHPAGYALGWQRTFRVAEHRYAVQHVAHSLSDWQRACRSAGLTIEAVAEPRLDPAEIAVEADFDRRALEMPVALVLRLRRARA
jgi:malonyl-CoA O-methyltransferase